MTTDLLSIRGVLSFSELNVQNIKAGYCFYSEDLICPVGSDIPSPYFVPEPGSIVLKDDGSFDHTGVIAISKEEALSGRISEDRASIFQYQR